MLDIIKNLVLALDDENGVSDICYNAISDLVGMVMGDDAMNALHSAVKVQGSKWFLPECNNSFVVWPEMVKMMANQYSN